MALTLETGLGLTRNANSDGGAGGNPTSEEIRDESSNILTDESGNSLFDSGA